jgi:methylated-DNA-[protein]-cysteine S-methyltransferase
MPGAPLTHNRLNFAFPTFVLEVAYDANYIYNAMFKAPANYVPSISETSSNKSGELNCEILRQLNCYLENPQFNFNLPLYPQGSVHQRQVWSQIARIPAGSTNSYGQIAKAINSAARAIGKACGSNPYPIFIPCHRVITATGSLGGFNSGNLFVNLGIKKWLLQHEGIILNS